MTKITIIEPQVVSEDILETTTVVPGVEGSTIYIESQQTVVVSDDSTININNIDIIETVLIEESAVEVVRVDVGIPGPPGISGGSAVFIHDVTSSGIVDDKVWDESGNHLFSAKTDSSFVTVIALVSGGIDDYRPTVIINEISAVVEETTTLRTFLATATVPLEVGENVIVIESSAGGRNTVTIERLAGGPAVLEVLISPLTAPQTKFRAGQTATLTVHTDLDAVSITVLAGGACASDAIATVTDGTAVVNIQISNVASDSAVSVIAFNDFGTGGDTFITSALPIDQVLPTLSLGISYPSSQYAVSELEECTLTTTATNFEEVNYTYPASLSGVPSYESVKLLLCLSDTPEEVVYVSAVARKFENNSTASFSVPVRVANTGAALTLNIDGNPTRLLRAPAGTVYTLRITSSQPLMSLSVAGITMTPLSGRMTWTGTFRIYDTTPSGNYNITANAIGAAEHPSEQSRIFTVGGFSSRTITWPAFSRVAPLGLSVYDQSHVSVSLGTKVLIRQEDATDRPNGFYIADANGSYNPNGAYIALSDVAFAGSNTTGTLQGTALES